MVVGLGGRHLGIIFDSPSPSTPALARLTAEPVGSVAVLRAFPEGTGLVVAGRLAALDGELIYFCYTRGSVSRVQ